MKHGFVKISSATPTIKVADSSYNAEQIKLLIKEAIDKKVKVLLTPELVLSGYTCGDLFLQDTLLDKVEEDFLDLVKYTKGKDIFVVVGMPLQKDGKLFNVAAAVFDGSILGFIPKLNIPNYSEFYEARHFTVGNTLVEIVDFHGMEVPFGSNIIFQCTNIKQLSIGIEICEDLWVPLSPSTHHALAGATVILNPSASDEYTGKSEFRLELIRNHSAKLVCGYVYSDAGEGESTTDLVFAGHNIITENGGVLAESKRFMNEMIISDVDVNKLSNERRRMTTFHVKRNTDYKYITFTFKEEEQTSLDRFIDKAPFIPRNVMDREKRCKEITLLQAYGLKKRMAHIGAKNAIIGISGGLDSTLALLVTCKAFDLLGLDRKGIYAVTMPCFGTTDRTYQNAMILSKKLGATLLEIPIRDAVLQHFKDIGHDSSVHDLTFENSQARERTQVLMDLGSKYNCLVVGTGDLSELALGWATYNGDHMSMYGVNASVPKTLIRYLVAYFADDMKDEELKAVLYDILDTPVSPELLPPVNGEIAQKTEDFVGPYELHDFFIYYVLRFGFTPSKVFYLAKEAFADEYEPEVLLKWLKNFYRRFFTQQFKRSCLPDGPKVGSVAVSPRGDLRMPSDASYQLWMKELESIEI